MDPIVIISPHFDDAVLSVGQLMAGRPDCHVVTVFAGCPKRSRQLTPYDQNSGFVSAGHAVATRRGEDDRALAVLSATAHRLDAIDDQYGEPSDDLADLLSMTVGHFFYEHPEAAPVVAGPLGLAHPDHHRVRRAFCELLTRRPYLQGWVYEDIPARVLWPEQVPEALAWWRGMGYDPTLGFMGTGPVETKQDAVRCYGSQLWALDQHCLYVPERLYRLWPVD